MVCHRGAGKTVACVNDLVARATYTKFPLARYAYVAPLRNQAKGLAWDYLKTFAEGLIGKKSEADLSVDFRHNGARITLYGADNPDAMRGLHFNGVILDEYGDMNPIMYTKILFPALQARRGWIVFIGTPKGKNHFYDIFIRACSDPTWYTFMLRASESGLLSPDILAHARKNMSQDEYDQEYECSFEAAVVGTYYSKIIAELESQHRISALVDYDSDFPVEVNMDIGRTDSAAAWFWQPRPDGIAVIDYEEEDGTGPEEWFDILSSKGYSYEKIWLPHDAKAKTFATRRSTIEQFLDAGFPVDIVPKLALQHGIDAARIILPKSYFNPRCAAGIEALRAYRRKWDPMSKSFSNLPMHDWSSHGSDAYRYLSLIARERIVKPPEEPKIISPVLPEPMYLEELFQEREDRMRRIGRFH